jgi:hypothetical protein
VDPMPGDMADVVHIPIEACYAIQHSYSIYNYCIYGKAMREERPRPFSARRRMGRTPATPQDAGEAVPGTVAVPALRSVLVFFLT